MDLYNSLLNSAVLQRNGNNVSEHFFSGTCRKSGTVYLTAYSGSAIVPGFDKTAVGIAQNGKVQGSINGLPVGGPYKLILSIGENGAEKYTAANILVGDLWILAGQSNMADSGYMPSKSENDPMVRGFYMDNRWDVAKDPLHNIIYAAAPVHGGNPNNPKKKFFRGTGPGVPFGIAMYKATGVPQGLIACAHGGTSLSQWDPALKNKGGYSLYGAFYERLQFLGGRVAGLLWYQGCNETGSEATVANYGKTTKRLFAAFRRDCKNPDLPIVFAQLGAFIAEANDTNRSENWLQVCQAQYEIGQTLPNTTCVPTIDLEMDDSIHLSNNAVVTLGKRFADAMLGLRKVVPEVPQIAFERATCFSDKVMNYAQIKVKFANVQGKLTAPGLASGFCVVDKSGKFVNEAVNVRLDGDCAIVRTRVPYLLFANSFMISYGGMLQPNANITDEAGRSLPRFMAGVKRMAANVSSIMQHALVSEAVFCDDSFEALKLPENFDSLKFTPGKFNQFYIPVPREQGDLDKAHKVYCYKFKIRLAEAMKLRMLFGADASFILYMDGKEIMRVCTTNPVVLDEFKLPLEAAAGEHEFVCVFASNSGCGWGICCRFIRLDGKIVPEFVPTEELI